MEPALVIGDVRRGVVRSVLAVGLAGCALSPSRFDALSARVEAGNAERREEARDELRRKGYVFSRRDVGPSATAERDAFRACLEFVGDPRAEDLSAGRTLHLRVSEGGRWIEVVAALHPACAFLRGSQGTVDVLRDGVSARLERYVGPAELARGPDGRTFEVRDRPRIFRTRRVLVEMTCNRMPGRDLPQLEVPPIVAVTWSPKPDPLPVLPVVYDRENLESTCNAFVE